MHAHMQSRGHLPANRNFIVSVPDSCPGVTEKLIGVIEHWANVRLMPQPPRYIFSFCAVFVSIQHRNPKT